MASRALEIVSTGAQTALSNLVSVVSGPRDNVITSILIIIIGLYAIYHMVGVIGGTLAYGCGRHRPGLMLERFSSSGDSAKQYFRNLALKNSKYNGRIEICQNKLAEIRSNFSGLHSEICFVVKQIDEGLAGNYASNVPDDERMFPAAEQAKRAADRKAKSYTYVENLKKRFSEANENVALVECFDDISEYETHELQELRAKLNADVDETESSMNALLKDCESLRNEISDKQIAIYYTSLAYNDKYIKELSRQMSKVNEPFAGSEVGVLSFNAQKTKVSSDPQNEPGVRVGKMEDTMVEIEGMLKNLDKAVQVFVNTVELQKKQLKQSKALATDTNLQTQKMNSAGANVKRDLPKP